MPRVHCESCQCSAAKFNKQFVHQKLQDKINESRQVVWFPSCTPVSCLLLPWRACTPFPLLLCIQYSCRGQGNSGSEGGNKHATDQECDISGHYKWYSWDVLCRHKGGPSSYFPVFDLWLLNKYLQIYKFKMLMPKAQLWLSKYGIISAEQRWTSLHPEQKLPFLLLHDRWQHSLGDRCAGTPMAQHAPVWVCRQSVSLLSVAPWCWFAEIISLLAAMSQVGEGVIHHSGSCVHYLPVERANLIARALPLSVVATIQNVRTTSTSGFYPYKWCVFEKWSQGCNVLPFQYCQYWCFEIPSGAAG